MSEHAFDWTVPHTDERTTRRPLRPADDPFYDAPADLAVLVPGTIVRSRQVRVAFLGLVTQRGLTAWQLAYRSTDHHGRAEVAVTTVLMPRGHDPKRSQQLVAYQCAIDPVPAPSPPWHSRHARGRASFACSPRQPRRQPGARANAH